jgi:hypothetical protein
MSRTERMIVAAGALLALASLGSAARAQTPPAATPVVDFEEPEYPPPSARWKVVAAGLGTTAVFYGAALGSSYIFTDTLGVNQLRTPIVGPWLAIGKGGCADGDDCSTALAVIRVVLTALDGAAQAGGLAIALEGMFMPTQEWAPPARAPSGAPPTPKSPAPTTPSPSPSNSDKNLFFLPTPMTVGSGGIGVGIVGRF